MFMNRNKDQEIIRLYRLLAEFLPFSIVKKEGFEGWVCDGRNISLPHSWNYSGEPTRFENVFTLERLRPNESCYLRAWFGGESLVLVDGKAYGEVNQYHKEVNLTPFCDGKEHKIEIETVARGLFGSREESVFKYSQFVVYDTDMMRTLHFVKNVIEVAKETSNSDLSKALIDVTDDFLTSVRIPRSSNVYLKTVSENPSILDQVMSTWSHPEFPTDECVYDIRVKEFLVKGFETYRENVMNLSRLFPKIGKIFVAGHAHIDYAWLWPISETKRKIVRTFSNAVQLAKRYPEFIYIQSSAQMYEDLKRSHPEVFEEIKELVKSGRWEPVGGMWVESDCNVPSTESLIRQFYYGQQFFLKEFGVKSKVAWLPDVFGFSWILPQVMKQAGVDYFVTTKLNWNESNDFPYDICRWRGIDGSEVIYYNFKNFEDGYNGRVSARSLINTFENFRQKDITNELFLSFGYGDGGGGPTEEMCENYSPLNDIPGVPYVEYSTAEKFAESLEKTLDGSKLPIWDSELYLELHRGTFTSQSRTKKLHRIAENELRSTEILNALFGEVYQEQIDELWKIMLRNEFHDILPGSSIKEVYDDAESELSHVIEECIRIQNEIMKAKTDGSTNYISVFNPSSYEQPVHFSQEEPAKISHDSQELYCTTSYDGNYVCCLQHSDANIPALGFETFKISKVQDEELKKQEDRTSQQVTGKYFMENSKIKVVINENGSINIYNKELKKWAFKDAGNLLNLYEDVPAYWENWDIDVRSKNSGIRLEAARIELLEKNDLREVVRALYVFESSTVEQFYILASFSDELKIHTKVDWHHRRMLLKVSFPTTVLSRYAKYDIDGGYIERPTHNNTNFEQARFEVLAHSWVDLSQYDYGVCVMTNGKYGHKVNDSTIEMTLLKAGIYPDFYADEGYHEFSYSIHMHPSCDVKEFYRRSERLNRPVKVFSGRLREPLTDIKVLSDNFRILSLRTVNGKLYLRILESVGSSGTSGVRIEIPGKEVKEVNLVDVLENRIQKLDFSNGYVTFEFAPFKFYTFEIQF